MIVPSWGSKADPFLHQPYWEMYFATIIKKEMKERVSLVDIIDFRGREETSTDSMVKAVEQRDLYFYWIFNTVNALETYEIAEALRKQYPTSIHVAGGTHVELCQEEAKAIFDSVVVGPGERSFLYAITDHIEGRRLAVYKDEWHEVPFSDTSYPERDFLPTERVINRSLFREYGNQLATMTYFSRGCIFKCAFCTLNTPSLLQTKDPKRISQEIDYLKMEYNVEAILLKDEIAIHPNSKISTGILDAIGKSDIIWRGQTITRNSYEQLKLARDSGCKELAVGVETVDENVMRNIGKQWQNKKQITQFIENAKKLGIKVKICLILGLPGEPHDIVEQSIRFIEENDVEYSNVSGLCPMPGSLMYKNKEKYGIKSVDHTWSNHAHLIYRFADEEGDVGLPFEYDSNSLFSKGRTMSNIRTDIKDLQNWLRENGKSY
jgi:radical SAM superfamily enzyme YgiQ (UPF0313 family)